MIKRKERKRCITGKTGYASEGVARSELAWFKMLKLHGDEEANQVRYYVCPHCGMYHLTSKEEKEHMITVIPTNKQFNSLENLKKTLNVTEVTDEPGLEKELSRGNRVYVYVDPYDVEMSSGEDRVLMWHTDEKKATEAYYLSLDEI